MELIDFSSVRSIPPKTKGNRGFFPSQKVPQGVAEYESQIERDFYLLLEHAPDITIYQHQPKVIAFTDKNNKPRKYIPDVYFELSNGIRALVEIKDEITYYKNQEKNKEKWEAADKWCKSKGILFFVLTDRDIRTSRLANIWFTIGSSRVSDNSDYMQKLSVMLNNKPTKYKDLIYFVAESFGVEVSKAAQIVCYAIYHGVIFVDSFSVSNLSNSTIIRRRLSTEEISPFQPLWMELDLALDQRPDNPEFQDENVTSIKSLSSYENIQIKNKDQRKLDVIKAWKKQPEHLRDAQWREDFYKKWEVSKTTLYRWIKKFKNEGKEGLKSKYSKRGKKSPYDEKSYGYFEIARKHYLKPDSTFNNAYEKLEEVWKHEKLQLPSKAMLEKYIYNNTTSSELAFNKRGRRYHKSKYTPSLGSFQGAIMPMQVLQFDNTPLDVFPVDSKYRLPLGTPHITAAVDCYTRMITGVYLSLSPSSSQSVLETLVQSILPKENYEETYNSQSIWPISGYPVMILVDNGMDYRAEVVKKFCRDYNIILEYAPIRTPRYKALIEQWFRILHHALNDENVGGLRPLLKLRLENPDLKPQSKAILTTQEIKQWLYSWIIDKYHFTNPYQDLQPAPFLRWENYIQSSTDLILPKAREAPDDEWEIDVMYIHTLNQYDRLLHSYGVRWKHLKFQSTELASLFGKIGPGNKVTVLIDRRDLRVAWVINPLDEKPIRVGLGSGWAAVFLEFYSNQPILLSAWEQEIKNFREKNITALTPHIFKMNYSREIRKKNLKNKKKITKSVRRGDEKVEESKINNIKNNLTFNDSSTEIGGEILDIEEEQEKFVKKTKMSDEPIEAFESDDNELRKSIFKHSKRRR